MNAEIVVVGAGIVGSAICYGLAKRGIDVLVIDGHDRDFRAANANFGLIWLQGKGMNMPAYQQLTRQSVELWPEFCAELEDVSKSDLQYERNGGLTICLGEEEYAARRETLMRLHNQLEGEDSDWEMIDRDTLAKLMPKALIGADVAGASFGHSDGHANPLRLLAALHAGIVQSGGRILGGNAVRTIRSDGHGAFILDTGKDQVAAQRIIIAAGLGSKDLAAQVGLDVPVRPQRGQILVTERLEPFLPLPASGLRQTREGTVLLGPTQEEAGFDTSTTSIATAALSAKAVRRVPSLADATLVRQWSGLRILTPDRHPIYAESETQPGAFVALCHSGVTLAAVHASTIAEAFMAKTLPQVLNVFHHRRFDVPEAK